MKGDFGWFWAIGAGPPLVDWRSLQLGPGWSLHVFVVDFFVVNSGGFFYCFLFVFLGCFLVLIFVAFFGVFVCYFWWFLFLFLGCVLVVHFFAVLFLGFFFGFWLVCFCGSHEIKNNGMARYRIKGMYYRRFPWLLFHTIPYWSH